MSDQIKERLRTHYQGLDARQTPTDLSSLPDLLTHPSRRVPRRGIRRFPAFAMLASFAAILLLALIIIRLGGRSQPDAIQPAPTPEETAVFAVEMWTDEVRSGNVEAAQRLFEPGSQADGYMTPDGRLGWLIAIAGDSQLADCATEHGANLSSLSQTLHDGTLIRVTCPWTISDPLSSAVAGETANLDFLVSPEGELVDILGVGVRPAWKDPFVDFALANYPDEFEEACKPVTFTDEQFLGHALTARCGQFYIEIADEIIASLE